MDGGSRSNQTTYGVLVLFSHDADFADIMRIAQQRFKTVLIHKSNFDVVENEDEGGEDNGDNGGSDEGGDSGDSGDEDGGRGQRRVRRRGSSYPPLGARRRGGVFYRSKKRKHPMRKEAVAAISVAWVINKCSVPVAFGELTELSSDIQRFFKSSKNINEGSC
ncbi:unnamed protein product [Arabidopsis arenosa]|uniref:Uncharacterized protein n=1 Tax=Arabidopsis arenosa TaxID=38785 RepID=A0A8S1ZF17_ARAAE|nr:unnamed protein product [Arabidopsis arenosa]